MFYLTSGNDTVISNGGGDFISFELSANNVFINISNGYFNYSSPSHLRILA